MAKSPSLEDLLADLDNGKPGQAKLRAAAGKMPDPTGEYTLLPVSDIHADPDQPRKKFKEIGQLADQIKAGGLLQPITVRPDDEGGGYILMYGERRLRAVKQLEWSHIPAIIRTVARNGKITKDQAEDIHDRQLLENIGREDMDIIDEARAVQAYIRRHKIATYKEAGKLLGKSESWVSQRMDLLALDDEDQEQVSSGAMTIGVGSTKAKALSGRLRPGSAAHDVAVKEGFVSHRSDRMPGTKSRGLSPQPTAAASRGPGPRLYGPTSTVIAHFTEDHPLAVLAGRRCKQESGFDKNAHAMKIGMIACGACWEAEIRNDQRNHGDPK